jgi:diketogulonate reductase-like aldo/keto reductase
MPRLAFGVFQPGGPRQQDTTAAVLTALEAGFHHVDAAAMYGNEAGVGDALIAAGLARDEVFVTTKLEDQAHGATEAPAALARSLERLRTDHVDLYLIHWPVPDEDQYVETWLSLQSALADGRVRALGVSNLDAPQLTQLIKRTGTVPAVNQVEIHPHLQQRELVAFHAAHGIVTQGWSPIARGRTLDDPTLEGIAVRHGCSVAQVAVGWQLQTGGAPIVKSATPSRIRENMGAWDVCLDEADLRAIQALDGATDGPASRWAEMLVTRPSWHP